MITGASSGLGRITAIELARMGANLTLVCRNRARGEEVIAEIRDKTANRTLTLMLADLSRQQSIRELAAAFIDRGEPLHVLVNNAGVFNLKREVTADGIEAVFAVNHLSYFMLTMLLLDCIKHSAPARIVNVASAAHHGATLDFDDLGGEGSYRSMRVYRRSKLANILFTYELARRLDGTRVTVNCAHPGAVATGLGANNGALAKLLMPLIGLFMRSPEQGAATQIYLASSSEVEGVTGKYFVDCKPAQSSAESHDIAVARRLWDASARMTGVGV
ncbi:MAG TPA: SDR family oxidoreductase [Candidatus Binataceae bacterium]|nr:SDR family oxidoreductase [Candidatus Binataceae bacterium]